VLDHAQRRGVPEQPARKHLAPGQWLIGARPLFDEQLDESAGLGRIFPRRGLLARGELDDGIADPPRFAALEDNVLRDVVALVEKAERCHAILDRCAEFAFDRRSRSRGNRRTALGRLGWRRRSLLAASGQHEHARKDERPGCRRCVRWHQASGTQAS
jgi:hypothetical protein